jgi:hypothetical protein
MRHAYIDGKEKKNVGTSKFCLVLFTLLVNSLRLFRQFVFLYTALDLECCSAHPSLTRESRDDSSSREAYREPLTTSKEIYNLLPPRRSTVFIFPPLKVYGGLSVFYGELVALFPDTVMLHNYSSRCHAQERSQPPTTDLSRHAG